MQSVHIGFCFSSVIFHKNRRMPHPHTTVPPGLRARHLPFSDLNHWMSPPHARSPLDLHASSIHPHEPSVTPLPESAIQGRGTFPTHGIRLCCHRREHSWLPHPGECHKWILCRHRQEHSWLSHRCLKPNPNHLQFRFIAIR
jgi:hypothetical protein